MMLRAQDLLMEVLQIIGFDIQDKRTFIKWVSSEVPSKIK